jgi:hypothetical protein
MSRAQAAMPMHQMARQVQQERTPVQAARGFGGLGSAVGASPLHHRRCPLPLRFQISTAKYFLLLQDVLTLQPHVLESIVQGPCMYLHHRREEYLAAV